MAAAATETTQLLEVDHHFRKEEGQHRHLKSTYLCGGLVLLVLSLIGVGVRVVLQAHEPHHKLTPSQQVALLNQLTLQKSGFLEDDTCKSTLLLMRHCEKEGKNVSDHWGNEHCSAVGYQRAQYVARLFGNSSFHKWPLPKKLYAMSRGRPGVHHLNYREIETLQPLQNKSGVSLDTRFSVGAEGRLARDYFGHLSGSQEYCSQVTVVNWKHSRIPLLARALGCGVDQGCPSVYPKREFDQVWQITYSLQRRRLKQSPSATTTSGNHHNTPQWSVHGKVVQEGFRPHI